MALRNTFLAFDTATELMSVAVCTQGRTFVHEAPGGALASATLLPAIIALLARAGVGLRELDAVAFGRGPGAFTGARAACSVAQGLAFGAAKPVLPIDTLLAVAEDARAGAAAFRVWAVNDARMNEIYAAQYAYANDQWQVLDAPLLASPEALMQRWQREPPDAVAGSALAAFAAVLDTGAARCHPAAQPRAAALLPLAQALWDAGGAVDAAFALPLYVRDKVAQTSAERADLQAAKALAEGRS